MTSLNDKEISHSIEKKGRERENTVLMNWLIREDVWILNSFLPSGCAATKSLELKTINALSIVSDANWQKICKRLKNALSTIFRKHFWETIFNLKFN